MKPNVFREYDIRGVVGKEFFIENVYELGKAIVTYYLKLHPLEKKIIIGRDGRAHSLDIQNNLMRAACDLGLDVIDIDVCPTPTLYFAVHTLSIQTALIVTASHNPKQYNGVKMWGVWGAQIQEIKDIYLNKKFVKPIGPAGSVIKHDMISPYLNYLEEKFGNLKNVTLNAVIDCGNGTAGTVIPKLIKKMGWKNIKLLCSEVDGTFPNHEADPTVPANMIMVKEALVSDNTLSVGLGLDGDCDRMNPMTKEGELIAGDKLLALFAQRALKDFPGASVVFDIKSSSSLIELLTKWGAKPCISPSGHSLIKETMAKTNAKLAGELSCHFFFHDRYFGYDDGIYAALRLFELLVTSGKTLTQLLTIIPHKENSPEIRIECASDEEKLKIVEHVKKVFSTRTDAKLITIDGIRAQMPYGWGLLRASNTQPVICLRFESETKEGLLRVKRDFFTGLQKLFDENKLKEQIGI